MKQIQLFSIDKDTIRSGIDQQDIKYTMGLMCVDCHFERPHVRCQRLYIELDMPDSLGLIDLSGARGGRRHGTLSGATGKRGSYEACRCKWCRAVKARDLISRKAAVVTQAQYEHHTLAIHCALCRGLFNDYGAPDKGANNPHRKEADHCHERNVYRGALCRACNISLGYPSSWSLKRAFNELMRRNSEWARAQAIYLVSSRIDEDGQQVWDPFSAWITE